MARVQLRKGHVRPVWAGHPWVFAQAIERIQGAPGAGDLVTVVDPMGRFLGRGFYSPKSAIAVRILSRRENEEVDAGWIVRRLEEAAAWRRKDLDLPNEETSAYRLVHAEGDHVPGLIADVYGDVVVVQLLTQGMKRLEDDLYAQIARIAGARTVIEAPSTKQRLEGFSTELRTVRGPAVSELRFLERGLELIVPRTIEQKTGYYLDQRDNRAVVEGLAKGRRVLDAFSFLGGFGLAAARGGAEKVVCIDSSAPAIAAAATIARHNGLDDRMELRRGNVRQALIDLASQEDRFDLVVLDPPKLIPSPKHLEPGRRAYQKLNAAAMRVVADGGLLLTCSCSASLREEDLLKVVGLAAAEARCQAQVLRSLHQAPDHPFPPAFPDGRYLKALLLRVSR